MNRDPATFGRYFVTVTWSQLSGRLLAALRRCLLYVSKRVIQT